MRPLQNLKPLLTFFLLLAAVEFVVRAPIRYLQPTNWNDLTQNYAATRIWLRGENFADPQNFVDLWRDEVHSPLDIRTGRVHIAPPLGSVVLMAPIGALPWPAAKIAWLGVLLISFSMTVWALAKTAGFHFGDAQGIAFIAGCLALAPFHTGIANGNQSILVIALCALGIYGANRESDIAAGLLFGAAASMKPHIAAFIVLYYLLRQRWKLFATAIGFTAFLALIAVGWMQLSGVSWKTDYFHNLVRFATQNRIDDFTSANPVRFLLVNLQVLFYTFTHQARSANLLAFLVGGALALAWTYFVIRRRPGCSELLPLSGIAVISMLPMYHRIYDASILAIPLCWCLTMPAGRLKGIAKATAILMLPFAVPGAAILEGLAHQGRFSYFLTRTWVGQSVIMPHQSWILLVVALILLYGLKVERDAGECSMAPATFPEHQNSFKHVSLAGENPGA